MHNDIGPLTSRSDQEILSLGLSAQICLPDGNRRADFLEVQIIFQDLARKYGTPAEDQATPASTETF